MKVYEVCIKPLSGFGTPLKGDTFFGCICWQIKYGGYDGMTLDDFLSDYDRNPFLVVSSFFPMLSGDYIFKRPSLPVHYLFSEKEDRLERITKRKEIKSKKWMVLKQGTKLETLKNPSLYKSDSEILEKLTLSKSFEQPRNTINRIWSTTGEAPFAPYTVEQSIYHPELYLVGFVGVREDVDFEKIRKIIENIGYFGFGKDATVGLGRFKVVQTREIDLTSMGSDSPNAIYTLSPFVPVEDFAEIYFNPFIRFGKHGDILSRASNPFKNPAIMADEAAVCVVKDKEIFSKPYVGTALRELSKVNPDTVGQGYSLYIPVRLEDYND